jgi:hypothetical protein
MLLPMAVLLAGPALVALGILLAPSSLREDLADLIAPAPAPAPAPEPAASAGSPTPSMAAPQVPAAVRFALPSPPGATAAVQRPPAGDLPTAASEAAPPAIPRLDALASVDALTESPAVGEPQPGAGPALPGAADAPAVVASIPSLSLADAVPAPPQAPPPADVMPGAPEVPSLDAPAPSVQAALPAGAAAPDLPDLAALAVPAPESAALDALRAPPPALAEPAPAAPETDAAPGAPEAVPAPDAPPGPQRLVLHYPSSAGEAAGGAADRITGLGLGAPTLTPVGFSISQTNVRFYHAADRESATRIAAALEGAGAGPVQARDFTDFRPSPPAGLVEVWLSGEPATQPTAQPPAPPPPAVAARPAQPQAVTPRPSIAERAAEREAAQAAALRREVERLLAEQLEGLQRR